LTSPYTTPLVQTLRQKKNLVEAIVDAHQQVLVTSKGAERPLLSTSLNGQIYLHRQPPTRRKRVLAVSVDDPGRGFNKLVGPRHDVEAFLAALTETGFSKGDITVLHNPDWRGIKDAISSLARTLRQQGAVAPLGRRMIAQTSLIRVGLVPVQEHKPEDNTLFVFFFSGHGIRVSDTDYIIPKLPGAGFIGRPQDVENGAVSLSVLLQMLEQSAAASVVILDTHFPPVTFDGPR